MESKKQSVWDKLRDADSAEWTLEEVKTVIHWFRQILACGCGILWGAIPLTGLYGFLAQLALNTLGTVVFYTTVMKLEPDEFGGHGTLSQEALPPSISMFLLTWIISYSLTQF